MSQIRQKCQQAFSAVVETKKATITEIADCYIAPALTGEEYVLPAIVIRAEKPAEIAPGANVYEVPMVIALASSPDDDAPVEEGLDRASLHQSRFRALYEIFFNVDPDDVAPFNRLVAELNKPSAGPDNRSIKEFTCSGYMLQEEEDGRIERHVEDSFTILVTCSMGDPA